MINEQGQAQSVLSFNRVRKLIEDSIGIVITDDEEGMLLSQPNTPSARVNEHANIPGANLQGINKGGAMGA